MNGLLTLVVFFITAKLLPTECSLPSRVGQSGDVVALSFTDWLGFSSHGPAYLGVLLSVIVFGALVSGSLVSDSCVVMRELVVSHPSEVRSWVRVVRMVVCNAIEVRVKRVEERGLLAVRDLIFVSDPGNCARRIVL
eukprot:GHVN01039061.1.p1 GENE.GHVN01039061.1~~GHVN01039061.1.p1  ORF type:complete len:137 (+),score=28.68 GHVN01039061.1:416-826(+)